MVNNHTVTITVNIISHDDVPSFPSTDYGTRMKLMFTGDEQDYDIWGVRFLGYVAMQGLKETILPSSTIVDSTKNEKAYAELVMLLDMIMTDLP